MKTLLLLASALAFPAIAAGPVAVGHGATAGRSPHQAYATEAPAGCGKTMHSIPAGKLPTYGRHAHPATPCPAMMVASAQKQVGQIARD